MMDSETTRLRKTTEDDLDREDGCHPLRRLKLWIDDYSERQRPIPSVVGVINEHEMRRSATKFGITLNFDGSKDL